MKYRARFIGGPMHDKWMTLASRPDVFELPAVERITPALLTEAAKGEALSVLRHIYVGLPSTKGYFIMLYIGRK